VSARSMYFKYTTRRDTKSK